MSEGTGYIWPSCFIVIKNEEGPGNKAYVSVDDTFGGSHKYRNKVLSDDKFHPKYKETRILLGHFPNTRQMSVELSPCRREKILEFLIEEKWVTTRELATIQEIAQVMGMMQSVCEFFP